MAFLEQENSMKRENRVRKNQEFDDIISKRKVINVPGFCLYWNNNDVNKISKK